MIGVLYASAATVKFAENNSPVSVGELVNEPVTAYSIVFVVSVGAQAPGPNLFTPAMHLTISVEPVRTLLEVSATPDGTRTVLFGARSTISKPLSAADPLTRMSTVTVAPADTAGPGIVGVVDGQVVEGCEAMQTIPTVDAWAACKIPGVA